jgi:hypothetical protein
MGLLCVPLTLAADDVYCKDGKVHRGLTLRREAGVIFGKHANPREGQEQDTILVANQVERIVFAEPPALREVRQAAYAGDARQVLEKSGSLIAEHRQWAEMPGNYWRDLMRAQVPALYVLGKNDELQQLITAWLPTGEPDLEDSVKLLALRLNGSDQGAFLEICKKATATGASTLVAAIAWIELGRAAAAEKQWPVAVRKFLAVEVFASSWRLLLPEALLGAARACTANGQSVQAALYAKELQSEFSRSEQASRVNEALSAPR